MHLLSALYRAAVRAYPAGFRARYGGEMARVFDEGLAEARAGGLSDLGRYCSRTMGDAIASATREHLAAMNRFSSGMTLLAVAAGIAASYVDFHASEVQATLLVLIVLNFALGCAAPRGAWRRALIVAILLPAIHVAAYALGDQLGDQGHPYLSRLLMIAPALIASFLGAYAGVIVRLLASV